MIGPVIQITTVTILPEETGEVPIQIFDLLPGLQGIEVSAISGDFLTFDPGIIQVLGVEAVDPFTLDAVNIDNINGRISFIARTSATGPFPTDGEILKLIVKGINTGESPLEISITNLADPDNLPIYNVKLIQGKVMIKGD